MVAAAGFGEKIVYKNKKSARYEFNNEGKQRSGWKFSAVAELNAFLFVQIEMISSGVMMSQKADLADFIVLGKMSSQPALVKRDV